MQKAVSKNNQSAFTLMELVVVTIVIAILAGIALPHFTAALERNRAVEGVNILGAIRSAQERFALANGGAYTTNILDIDVDIPVPLNYFETPEICAGGGAVPLARIRDIPRRYRLLIYDNGDIECHGNVLCQRMGFTQIAALPNCP
ncbi:MAG: prepilin-type N-terminal cleavage/methylation domain-containing protein [Candidatus Omnitrophota bacterium]